MKTTTALPHWDTSSLYPSLGSPEFETDFNRLADEIAALKKTFDDRGIGAGGPDDVELFDDVTNRYNEIGELARTVGAFIRTFTTTDVRNDDAQAWLSKFFAQSVEVDKLNTRYDAWMGSLDIDRVIERSPLAREHAFPLRRAQQAAQHQMSAAEEDLAASLSMSGQVAWARLYGDIASRLTVRLGDDRVLPMSAVRGLATDPDPDVRRTAYAAELEAWETVAVPVAACLNGVKGATLELSKRRGWDEPLEAVFFGNNVDRETVEAMQSACVASFPDWRRYFRAKARLLGHSGGLPWYDLFAPVGDAARRWDYGSAAEFVVEQFGGYSPSLAALAKRAFDESWVDAEPRVGKRDGAFCMGVRPGESRILLNFKPAFGSVATLAHELGHAYHGVCLTSRTPLARRTPMALAETASIFCQTIITNAMLRDAEGAERLAILEAELVSSAQVVVDIHSRFLFERAVFERRAARDLSVAELKDEMLRAQEETYGDGLDPDVRHEYMWAAKSHYYGRSFYNWPYTFGLLFGLGLYARYEADPDGFRAGYDDLLSRTGLEDAASLGRRFDIDIRDEAFWIASLDVLRSRIDEYEALVTG